MMHEVRRNDYGLKATRLSRRLCSFDTGIAKSDRLAKLFKDKSQIDIHFMVCVFYIFIMTMLDGLKPCNKVIDL